MKCVFSFLNNNRIKVLSFLFVLVFFGSVKLVTETKYVSYVNTYTAASAGEFYFGSNYLASEDDGYTYTISNWDQRKYSVVVKIQNYENSLLYNSADVGFYYTLVGVMYTDEACTQVDETFYNTITFSSDIDTVEIDGVTYGYMEGMSSFDKTAGEQSVTVTMESSYYATDTMYLKIKAYVVPILPEENVVEENVDEEDLSEDVTEYDNTGVFYSELEAVFILQQSSRSAVVTSTLTQNTNNAEVQLRITCPEIADATYQTVRVYFKTDLLEGDTKTLGSIYTSSEYAGYSYSDISVNASSVTTVLLFKTSSETIELGTSLTNMGDVYVDSIY